MGLVDKFKGLVNPDPYPEENDEAYEGYEGEGYEDDDQDYAPVQNTAPAHQTYGGLGGNAALELKVVRPERFDSVTQIADHLINNRTVVLNLEATNKETARRMIDFLSGVAYSIDGNLKKVANNTYVITPGNVAVTNDQNPAATQFQQAAQAPVQENNYNNL